MVTTLQVLGGVFGFATIWLLCAGLSAFLWNATVVPLLGWKHMDMRDKLDFWAAFFFWWLALGGLTIYAVWKTVFKLPLLAVYWLSDVGEKAGDRVGNLAKTINDFKE